MNDNQVMNGHDVVDGVPFPEVPREKDKKKDKKKRKKEERKRLELLERFPPTPPRISNGQVIDAEVAAGQQQQPGRRNQDWLRPAFRSLNATQLVIAQKSSTLIAINCAMLSLAAFSVTRGGEGAQLWWALVPLALTNLLSLLFGILSAQDQQFTALDELCSMPEDEYDDALNAITQDKQHLYTSLRRDVRSAGVDLARRQRHLRTAYNVLLGGVPLSIVMFGICVAVSSRA